MNSAPALAVCLACAAMGASAAVHAQARGPANRAMRSNELPVERPPLALDEATRSKRIAEMEAWLGRLVGRFSVDAKYAYAGGYYPIYGTAICSHFGDGPGVRCIIQRTSPTPVMRSPVFQLEGAREHAALPLMYFGINADSMEIQAMVVDLEQVGAQSGVLAGDAVNFSDNWKACLRNWAYCWMVTEIAAKAAGEVFVKIAIDHWLQGSKGPPMALLKSGHTAELEVNLLRVPPADRQLPRDAP